MRISVESAQILVAPFLLVFLFYFHLIHLLPLIEIANIPIIAMIYTTTPASYAPKNGTFPDVAFETTRAGKISNPYR
jgi:hypothetical protein